MLAPLTRARSVHLRREVVLFCAKLPLSLHETSEILGIAMDDIANDRRICKARGCNVPTADTSYAAKLALFVTATEKTLDGFDDTYQEKIASVLSVSLKLKEAKMHAEGMLAGIAMGRNPKVHPELRYFQRLVDEIFDRDGWEPETLNFTQELLRWHSQKDYSSVAVKNFKDLAAQLVASASDAFEPPDGMVHVVLTDATQAVLDETIAALTDRQRRILGYRFPKDGSAGEIFTDIGAKEGISYERARQIYLQALERLHDHLISHHNVSPLSAIDVDVVAWRKSVVALQNEVRELKEKLAEAERNTVEVREQNEDEVRRDSAQLRRRFNEFPLSVRLKNTLDRHGIEFVWHVCHMNEKSLLKMKGFGKKGLIELTAIIDSLGLRYGMSIPNSVKLP